MSLPVIRKEKQSKPVTAGIFHDQLCDIFQTHPDAMVEVNGSLVSQASNAIYNSKDNTLRIFVIPVSQ